MEDFYLKWEDCKPLREHIREMYNVVESNVTNLTQILDNTRDFDIELEEDAENIDIFLDKDGNRIFMSDYLPEGYIFKTFTEYSSNTLNKEICFPKKEIKNQLFLLQLLHEIGHANDTETNKKVREIVSRKVDARNQGAIKSIYYACKYRNMFFLKNSKVLPKWYLEEYTKIRAVSEKRAWAIAIKIAEDLKVEGFDIFDEYTVGFMNMCLMTYEISAINDRYLSGLPLSSKDINLFLENGGTELVKKFI